MATENDSNEPQPEQAEAPAVEQAAEEASAASAEADVQQEVSETDKAPAAEDASPAVQQESAAVTTPTAPNEKGAQDRGGQEARGGRRNDGRGRGPGRGGNRPPREEKESDGLEEKVVFINRCAKVVKGGRRFSFSALVVVGDQQSSVGIGFGKANEVAEAIKKASDASRKDMVKIPVIEGRTIPHEVTGRHRGGVVLLKPASPGTGIIAGSSVRSVVESAGIKDVLTKSLGSNNHANVVKATLNALRSLRTREEIYKVRGKKLAEQKAI